MKKTAGFFATENRKDILTEKEIKCVLKYKHTKAHHGNVQFKQKETAKIVQNNRKEGK